MPLLFLQTILLFSQQTDLSVDEEAGRYVISITMLDASTEKLIDSIREGYTAEVSFQIRLYKKMTGLFRIFGDRMIAEYHPTFEARWDVFNNHFTIVDTEGRPHIYTSREKFLDHFLHLSEFPISFEMQEGEEYYILSNVRLNTMKLVPPLTLLAPLLRGRWESSSWVRKPLPLDAGPVSSTPAATIRSPEGDHPG